MVPKSYCIIIEVQIQLVVADWSYDDLVYSADC
jgi:hypothetical protein